MIGRIIFYNSTKQFGFVQVESNQDGAKTLQDYFFHLMSFKPGEVAKLGEIKLGKLIAFKLGEPFKLGMKQQAVNIRVATPTDIELTAGTAALGGV
jgi:hypothetical protein